MPAKISIIIPTLSNTKGLKYLLNYFSDKPYPLIIIDNDPKIKKPILKEDKNILYLPQKKNLGFAKAVNLGVEKARTEWVLILNDDIRFEIPKSKFQIPNKSQISNSKFQTKEDLIENLLKFAKKYELDAASPVLINPKGEIENAGYEVLPYGKVKLIKDLKVWNLVLGNWKLFGDWSLVIGNYTVDGLTAACLLIKRNVFLKVGGFDERFFAYLEDVDLFLTLKEKGYKFAVCPNIVVLHNHMTTGKRLGWKKNWHDFKNWILIVLKHPKHFKLSLSTFQPSNLLTLLLERLRNFWGMVKSVRVRGLKS